MATLELDERERKLLDEWNEKHLEHHHGGKEPYAGAIGGRLSFKIVYTSIGTIVKVTCALCKKHHENVHTVDLTDYDSW